VIATRLKRPERLPRLPRTPLWLVLGLIPLFAAAAPGWCANAVAQFGEPKYPPGFTHFDYVDADAPKGGALTLSVVSQNSSYDKLNPFSFKGNAAPGLLDLVFETLTVESMDEINTQYGLLADDIRVARDFSSVTFHINPRARFSNGDPVTAKDVKYSFDTLTGAKASARFKAYFSEISAATVLDPQTLRFDFSRTGRDLSFVAGSLPVFSPKWGRLDGAKIPFDKLRFEGPIASGPYTVDGAGYGQGVTYRRNAAYWANDLPVRRGMYNFDEVVYKIYKDADTQVAALRAGDFDVMSDSRMRYWCCQYIGKRFDDGDLIKEVIPTREPPPFNGWVLNLRRPRFRDLRVREALDYAFDFEWMNQKIFIGEFERTQSYFPNTPLAAAGPPSADELKLLEPYKNQLAPETFGPMVVQPSTKPPSSLRHNLTEALRLFAAAGWHNRDGVLRNDEGEPFVIEISSASREQNPYMDPIYLNLSKLGIVIKKKLQDAAASRQRMGRFDYDYASISLPAGRMPGPQLWRSFNSADADVQGSENIAGLKSPAADGLIKDMLEAQSEAELETAAHALDRVLMHGYYVIPWRYLTHNYLIRKSSLRRPQVLPQYYDPYGWAQATWWDGSNRRP
jgi:microcin C transport system substrate-binding protein